jgi:DsbC/DsbD-like thiol-disulfide interchange protein
MRSFVFIAATLAVAPSLAAESAWQELMPGVRARLVTSDVLNPDGTTLAGIQIEMPQNYKTYWKTPGQTGIPTQIDLKGSQGVDGYEIRWPYPVVDNAAGYLDYVYFGPTVLPLQLKVTGDKASVVVSALMGICSDICTPAKASFAMPLSFAKADAGENLRLRQALANTPMPWQQNPEPVGDVVLDQASGDLKIHVDDTRLDPASLIASFEDASLIFGMPQKSPEPGIVVLPSLGTDSIEGLEGQPVQLTFMTDMGPFEVSRRVLPQAASTR